MAVRQLRNTIHTQIRGKIRRWRVRDRREILDRAAHLYRTQGFHATTMAQIGAAVGILGGSLYHHIESKEALLYEIVEAGTRGLLSAVYEASRQPGSAGARLRAAILAHLRFSTDPARADYAVVFLNEIFNLRDPHMRRALLQLAKHYEDIFAGIIKDGVASKEFRSKVDVQMVVYAVLGMGNWTPRWFRPDGRLSVEQIANEYADLVVHGLSSRNTRPRET